MVFVREQTPVNVITCYKLLTFPVGEGKDRLRFSLGGCSLFRESFISRI